MGVLSWLKGAANRSAKNNKRSAKQQNKPKKKKEQPRQTSSRPAQTSHSTSSQNKGGAYKPKAYTANKTSTFQPRTFKPSASTTQTRYAQFKASNVAPKAYKATATTAKEKPENKPTPVRGAITKSTVAPKPRTGSRFDLPKGYDYKKDLKQAAKKGANTTYLGTPQKKETITLKSKAQQKKEYTQQKKDYYKSNDWKSTKADIKTYNTQRWRKALSDEGLSRVEIDEWLNSEEGKKHVSKTYAEIKTATKKNINKGIAKGIKDISKLDSVNALKKGEFNQMVTASSLGPDLGNKFLKSSPKRFGSKDISKKIGSKSAASAYKGKFITGALQGSGPVDIINSNVGTYTKAAREANRQTKGSGAYIAGYVGGQMAGFGLTKTTSMGKALAQGVFKGASKTAGKKLAQNAVMTAAAETPMNTLDAVKMATDENGKIDGITDEAVEENKNPSGTDQSSNDDYILSHWIADVDVTLEDGTIIKADHPITTEQIEQVIVNQDITFTAIHIPKVTTPETGTFTNGIDAAQIFTVSLFGVLGCGLAIKYLPRALRKKVNFDK